MAGVSISLEPVLLGSLVDEHLSLYETAAVGKKIQLIDEVDTKLHVNVDKHVLSLALRNLISNTIKYSFEHGMITIQPIKQMAGCRFRFPIVEGHSYKMIAGKLSITYDTVRAHMKKIYEKLHVASMTEAVAKAINQRLFSGK